MYLFGKLPIRFTSKLNSDQMFDPLKESGIVITTYHMLSIR